MPRRKVKIDNDTQRRDTYKKRQKVAFKKTQELSTLCDCEVGNLVLFVIVKHGISLSKDQCPKIDEETKSMKTVPYASAYLKRTRDYMLVYHSDELFPIMYTDSDFQPDMDSRNSTSGNVFTLGGGAIVWRSIKQTCVSDSTMEAEYVAAKEAVWLRNFLKDLAVVPAIQKPLTMFCDNSGAVANSKEPRSHKKAKHIE
uniref:MADS-box domain-containing protein n=1 Tax=Solanum lycopersicum TaxID=4081 RepID=A0A3Q7JAH2_SOLLC